MNREQLKTKILREVVILYFEHHLKNEDLINSDLYDVFFYRWYKKLLAEDVNDFTVEELETMKKEFNDMANIYYPLPSSHQQLALHDINHSLEKYISLQKCANE